PRRNTDHTCRSPGRGAHRPTYPGPVRDTESGAGRTEQHGALEPLRVWIDQELCTGDGLCVQYAPEVFEFDIDGLAYVKDRDGELLAAAGATTDVPTGLRQDVIASAKECPGACIHVVRAVDGREVAGPEADDST